MRCTLFTVSLFLLLLSSFSSLAQAPALTEPGTRTVHLYSDVYKTDYTEPFRKVQFGVEAGYQLNNKLSITGGLEFWNEEPSPLLALGNRFYPFGNTYVRYRALVGRNADVGLGLGYSLRISKRLVLEAASDYYIDQREIGLRLGIGYLWWKQ